MVSSEGQAGPVKSSSELLYQYVHSLHSGLDSPIVIKRLSFPHYNRGRGGPMLYLCILFVRGFHVIMARWSHI